MSGFTAAALSGLDYDLTGISREDGEVFADKGVVPEPTDARLVAFYESLAGIVGTPVDPEKPEEAASAIESALTAAFPKLRAALSDLCAGSPSPDVIAQMPPRVLGAFATWLQGELAPKG